MARRLKIRRKKRSRRALDLCSICLAKRKTESPRAYSVIHLEAVCSEVGLGRCLEVSLRKMARRRTSLPDPSSGTLSLVVHSLET